MSVFLDLVLGLIGSGLMALAFGFVLAIDPTTRRPGVGVLINLRTGSSTSGGGEVRFLLIGVKNAADGTTTPEDAVHEDVLPDDVSALCGPGGLTHIAAQRLFEEFPTASVDLVVMAAPAGNTATGTITFDDASPVTADRTVVANIIGVEIGSVWLVGETDIQAATRLVARINAQSRRLPVIASNAGGASAVVTLTAKSKGKWGNDIRIRCVLTDGAGGAVSTSGAQLTGGTTDPDVAAVLALVTQREYRLIVPCLSNADLATASASSNMGKIRTHIAGNNSGIGALLQTAVTACTDSTTNAKAMSGQHDFEYFNHTLCRGGESLPAEFGAAIAGMYGREIKLDANHPFVKATFNARTQIYGSAAIDTDALSAAEEEDLLNSGVSYIEYTSGTAKRPRLARPITTYFEDDDGNPDDRILDVSKVYGMIAVAADLRVECERAWQGLKLMKTLPSGRTPIPPGVVGEADAKSFVIARIRTQWVKPGVINGDRLDAAIADGSLIVQVDDVDETQLDVFLPLRVIPPLVKTSLTFVQA